LVINLKTEKALGIAAPRFARRRGDRISQPLSNGISQRKSSRD
jgi:hypothetical protein